jgi:hypothetical protein
MHTQNNHNLNIKIIGELVLENLNYWLSWITGKWRL